jgi:hypothetical protein
MKYHHVITGLGACLIVLSATNGKAATPEHATRKVAGLFSVPFFIENINATAPNALRADFKLREPAILESFFIYCAGAPRGGLLLMDGGPAGVNDTTGVGADANVGLVVGLISGLEIPLTIDFTVSANGAYFFSPTHLGVPIKSNYSFIVFPNAPNSVQCNGNAVFRDVD